MPTSRADKPPVISTGPDAGPRDGDAGAAHSTALLPGPTIAPACSSPADLLPRRVVPGTLLHWVFLVLATLVMLASFSFRVRNGEQVIVPLIDKPLPGTCTFRNVTGVPCPGCGLTRSFISIGHGQWLDAWHYNPAGFVFFAMIAFQIPYRIYQIFRIRRGRHQHRFRYLDNWVLIVLVIALVLQWIYGRIVQFW